MNTDTTNLVCDVEADASSVSMADDTDIDKTSKQDIEDDSCQHPDSITTQEPKCQRETNQQAEPSQESAMARLLLASSMAQRDMAINDHEVNPGSHPSPRPSSPKCRTPTSSNHSTSPPVLVSERDRSSPPLEHGISHIDNMQTDVDYGKDATYLLPDSSPEPNPVDPMGTPANGTMSMNVYKCRLCNFFTTTYTQLQLHMPKHGGVKALKCPLCDYTTNDKSNFRRHRRLHIGNNPVNVLKCAKCSFSTILPRKFREHFIQVHNEHITTNLPYSLPSHSTYPSQTYTDPPFGIHQTDLLAQPLRHTSTNGNLSASNALHSLLTGMHHQTPPLSYHRQSYTTPNQGIAQYGNYVTPIRQQNHEENHMASNYLRSIVSSIMNTHPPPRIPPSSTITSSGYYLTPSMRDHSHISATQSSVLSSSLSQEVKVKLEPPERDDTPDVSSSAIPSHAQGIQENRPSRDIFHRQPSDQFLTMETNEASTSVRTNSCGSSQSSQQEGRSSIDNSVNTTVKMDVHNKGVQCNLPQIKSESAFGSLVSVTDQGIQCELLTPTTHSTQRVHSVTGQPNDQHNRCLHCGILFDDEVLYYIHVGCHSHTDPFVCNVCGKQCGNKYGFYSHIMRGHHY